MKKYLILFFIILLSCAIGMVSYFLFFPTLTQPDGTIYYVSPGTTKTKLFADLQQQHIIKQPVLFTLYGYFQSNAHLKAGEYFFPQGSTIISIWRQITEGSGFVYRRFVIVPGWSFKQLREALAHAEHLKHTSVYLTDQQIMTYLGRPDLQPEGEFLPETYYYTRGISDLIILKNAFAMMQTKLHETWSHRNPDLPYQTEYQALVAASLIEKEAFLRTELPVIAGVLVNRLKKDMLLQFDPTVIYGAGARYNGKIYKKDLLDNNPFNTYVHKGLPPTPIAMPSMAAIVAVMHPAQHNYFYFVAKGNGSHQFSYTLVEHTQAVQMVKKYSYYFNDKKILSYLTPLVVKKQNLILITSEKT